LLQSAYVFYLSAERPASILATRISTKEHRLAHILVVGLGDLGSAVARRFHAEGHQVSGIRQQATAIAGVDLYPQDLINDPVVLPPDQIDLLYIVLTPAQRSVEGYQNAFLTAPTRLLDAIAVQQPLPPLIFVSSTAVYGKISGWVDEQTPPKPDQFNGRILLAAEEELSLRTLTTVVRFSGIYGPGRERMLTMAQSLSAQRLADPQTGGPEPAWTNRIHRDDCLSLLHVIGERWLAGEMVPPLIIGTDNMPCLNTTALNWIAQQQGLRLELAEPDIAPGKRIRSDYLANLINSTNQPSDQASDQRKTERPNKPFTLRYPDFRAGYRAIIESNERASN
jgi:nucleoside-diphosphate-sugar epimerase